MKMEKNNAAECHLQIFGIKLEIFLNEKNILYSSWGEHEYLFQIIWLFCQKSDLFYWKL